jgi:hypothetical protein
VFLERAPADAEARISTPPASLLALTIAGGAMLWIGIAPGTVLEYSKIAVAPLGTLIP